MISKVPATAKYLEVSQVQSYHDEGFLIVPKLFSQLEIEKLALDVDRLLKDHQPHLQPHNMRVRFKPHHLTGESLVEVLDPIADLSDVAAQITKDERLHQVLHDLYGEPAELFKEKLIYKPAGSEGASLHQDWISWPGFPTTFLTVLVAIDPFHESSGATEVYPRLHQQGYLSPQDGQHHLLTEEQLGTSPVPLILEPGDVAIFGCFTPHRSAPNTSSQSRRGYFISYNAHSDGGPQYEKHYREFHDWIRAKVPSPNREKLFFR